MKPYEWTIFETMKALATKELSMVELVDVYLERIHKYNPNLKAFITVADDARDKAQWLDDRRSLGQAPLPLTGVILAVKDLFDTAGMRTTYGGRHFGEHIPSTTATVVRRLEEAGAIVIGKTNLHEYAYGTTTENPHYGNVLNPWNRGKIAGGSSGGSSAALAAGLCNAALGTDTGGSIRIPASLCGHVGLKPSFGLVSTTGVFPLAYTLDHVGPMTRSVKDAALLLNYMAGYDPFNPRSKRLPARDYLAEANRPRKFTLGVPKNFFFERCHASVLQVVMTALQELQSRGIELCEIEIPNITDMPGMQNSVIASEALAIHKDLFAANPELYGDDVRRRLTSASEVKGSDYVVATEFRRNFIENLHSLFRRGGVDAVVTPTTPLTATDIGQYKTHIKAHEVNIRGHLTRNTNPWNFSGLPAVSVPCGFSQDMLPVGLQIVGPMHAEEKILRIAEFAEQVMGQTTLAPEFR